LKDCKWALDCWAEIFGIQVTVPPPLPSSAPDPGPSISPNTPRGTPSRVWVAIVATALITALSMTAFYEWRTRTRIGGNTVEARGAAAQPAIADPAPVTPTPESRGAVAAERGGGLSTTPPQTPASALAPPPSTPPRSEIATAAGAQNLAAVTLQRPDPAGANTGSGVEASPRLTALGGEKAAYPLGTVESPDRSLNVREEASPAGRVVREIPNGEKLRILRTGGDWWVVQMEDGMSGYARSKFVRIVWEDEVTKTARMRYERATALLRGEEGTADPAVILQLARLAADAGYPAAQYLLGYMYAKGIGVNVNDSQTVAWFTKAAERGFPEAQHDLAVRYVQGKGIPPNEQTAIFWYRKAAAAGYPGAAEALKLHGQP